MDATTATTENRGTSLSRFGIGMLWFITGLAFFFTLTSYRLLPDVFLLICVLVWARNPQIRRVRMVATFLATFLLMEALLPFDVSLLYRPGRPRVVRLLMGLPAQSAIQRAQRGEVVLGDCIVFGNEPRWILVW